MKHTEVRLHLPFRICDRCSMLDVVTHISSLNDTQGRMTYRYIHVGCKNSEVCNKLYRMINEEVAQAQSGGDGVDKTVD